MMGGGVAPYPDAGAAAVHSERAITTRGRAGGAG
jgi:hypothetical protein